MIGGTMLHCSRCVKSQFVLQESAWGGDVCFPIFGLFRINREVPLPRVTHLHPWHCDLPIEASFFHTSVSLLPSLHPKECSSVLAISNVKALFPTKHKIWRCGQHMVPKPAHHHLTLKNIMVRNRTEGCAVKRDSFMVICSQASKKKLFRN